MDYVKKKPDFVIDVDDSTEANTIDLEPIIEESMEPTDIIDTQESAPLESVILKSDHHNLAQHDGDIKAETVIIVEKSTTPNYTFSQIEPQLEKWNHFKFKDTRMANDLIQDIGHSGNYNGIYNYKGQKHADLTITSKNNDSSVIGKIHFLHFDRRDKGIKKNYYIKLYFYQFRNFNDFETIKRVLMDFFFSKVIRTPLAKRVPRYTKKLHKRQRMHAKKKLHTRKHHRKN
jgi:hypothetical protein